MLSIRKVRLLITSRYIAMQSYECVIISKMFLIYLISYGCNGGALVFLGGAEASASPSFALPMFITIKKIIILHLFLGATPLVWTIYQKYSLKQEASERRRDRHNTLRFISQSTAVNGNRKTLCKPLNHSRWTSRCCVSGKRSEINSRDPVPITLTCRTLRCQSAPPLYLSEAPPPMPSWFHLSHKSIIENYMWPWVTKPVINRRHIEPGPDYTIGIMGPREGKNFFLSVCTLSANSALMGKRYLQ